MIIGQFEAWQSAPVHQCTTGRGFDAETDAEFNDVYSNLEPLKTNACITR